MNKKVVAVIQARMNSERLPGKVLQEIAGEAMLAHVVRRVRGAKTISQVVVATSQGVADDPVHLFCETNGIAVFRGSEEDVLDRYYQAAKKFQADVVVRVTADCPLCDPAVIDKVVGTYLENDCDYAANTLQFTYPDGLDTEVFSFSALERAWREAEKKSDREHVTPYLYQSGKFRVAAVECESPLPLDHLRWTVDEAKDREFVEAVYQRLGGEKNAGWQKVLQILEREPDLIRINQSGIRNEGFYKGLMKEPPVPPKARSLKNSLALKEKAARLIPSLSQTFSKGPTQFVQGVAPVFLERGEGARVWDVDGNEYIDFAMALGPVILGHNYPAVVEAAYEQMKKGTTFSLPHPLECEVAEMLTELIPCAEMIRFGKNGSDVTAGAVRAARAATGREIIACCGYHGWQDWYIGTTTRRRGVPAAVCELTKPFRYNNIQSLEKIFSENPGKVAGVIMEPVGLEGPQNNFLQNVAALTRREGALLIFDEMLTGFRLSLGGAQEYFGVTPDLACFGKACANGFPLSIVAGPKEIMNLFDEIFFSFTFGGEAVSLAAAKATLTEMRQKNVIRHLWTMGQKLKDGCNVLAKEYGVGSIVECAGFAPRTVVNFKGRSAAESLLYKSLFQQECLKRGILFTDDHNICYTLGEGEVDETLRVYRTVMEIFSAAVAKGEVEKKLEGSRVQPVFRDEAFQ